VKEVYRDCASLVVFRPASGAFEVLLLRKPRKRDRWQLPQGGMEEGESLERAALRELREEGGIDATAIGRSNVIYQYNFPASYRKFRPDNVRGQRIRFVFAKAAADAVVKVDGKEIVAFRWVPPAQLPHYLFRKEYLEIVRSLVQEGAKLLG
jgi:putative (di)nucleoside polyphosphate hydrolase